jgi:hypothetical protein
LLAAAFVAAMGPAAAQAKTLRVQNASAAPRQQVVRVSVPFAEGEAPKLEGWSVRDMPTAWRVLTRWPDGSAQWAQAQFVDQLGAGQGKEYQVVQEARPVEGGFVLPERLAALLLGGHLRTEVIDPFGARYVANFAPDSRAGKDGLLEESPLVRVYRLRSYHLPVDPARSIGRDFLSLTAYLTLFSGFEHAELTLVLGNDYLGSDDPQGSEDPNLYPLGLTRLRGASLLVEHPRLAFMPRWIRENGLKPPTPITREDGVQIGWRQVLLPESDWLLGDAQTKAWRFVLFAPLEDPKKAPEDPAELLRRQTASAIASAPLYGMPDVEDIRRSRAMNAHGGPAPASPDVQQRAQAAYARWRSRDHFGPFGLWGDIGPTGTTGTPRNTTIGLHLAARSGSRLAMLKAEGMALQQAIRGYHLWGLQLREEQDIFLAGVPKWANGWVSRDTLGRSKTPQALERLREGFQWRDPGPNGVNPFDYEHFTVDLLYDFYCLTGDAWTREELRVIGQQLRGILVLRPKYFYGHMFSSRGEGWCMKALVLCYLATGDESLKQRGIARLHRVIEPERGKAPNAYAVSQEPHPNAFGPGVRWDAPWQQAAFVMGMAAAYRYFGDPLFRDVALDVAGYMARQGWAEGVGPKYFVAIEDPERYSLPKGYSPLGGTAEFQVPAFVLAAELAQELGRDADARLFRQRADAIALSSAPSGDRLNNKWLQIYFDRRGR